MQRNCNEFSSRTFPEFLVFKVSSVGPGDQIAMLVKKFVEMVGEINRFRSIIQEDAKLYHFPHVMVLYLYWNEEFASNLLYCLILCRNLLSCNV